MPEWTFFSTLMNLMKVDTGLLNSRQKDAPESVYCRDWFSTHSSEETGGRFVICSNDVLRPICICAVSCVCTK